MAVVVISFLLLVAVSVAVLAVMRSRSQAERRNRGLVELAADLGLEHLDKADTEFRDAWSALPGIPRSGECRHVMFGALGGLPVTAFRHRYVVSTGQSTQVIFHWVFSTDVPHWPATHLKPRSGLARLLGKRSGVSSDPALDRAWVIKAEDRAFADTLLGPPVRSLLAEQLQGERWVRGRRWHVLEGKLCLVNRGNLSDERVRAGFAALESMLAAIGREPVGREAAG
jgi:hypothetical protein